MTSRLTHEMSLIDDPGISSIGTPDSHHHSSNAL